MITGLLLAALRGSGSSVAPSTQQWMFPTKGRITSPFGPRTHPVTGEQGKMHNGVDIGKRQPVYLMISGRVGEPIYAVADGIVSGRNYNDIGGNQLMIVHGNGYQSGYSHLSKYHVNVGDKVMKGQLIAEMGKTGRVTGPHLHFSVKDKQKNFVDPIKFIPMPS